MFKNMYKYRFVCSLSFFKYNNIGKKFIYLIIKIYWFFLLNEMIINEFFERSIYLNKN